MLSNRILRRLPATTKYIVRFKNGPNHWSVIRKKTHPVDKALAHFDDFYKEVFGPKWEQVRKGLLSQQKYVAVVNNFADNEETMSTFEQNGALNVRRLFELEKQYIQESHAELKRKKLLQQIRTSAEEDKPQETPKEKTTKVLKSSAVAAEETEVIPESVPKDVSLRASLDAAEPDMRRLVDLKNAMSSEILHEFIPATKIMGKSDFIPESEHYQYYDQTGDFKVPVQKIRELHFPEHLNVYCFEKGNNSTFRPAKNGATGVLNYYCMDGGSVLPILALDLRPKCRVLDLCAAPGGKSLLAIQTLYPDSVVSNDISTSRSNRIYNVYKQFLYDLTERWLDTGRVKITTKDGRHIQNAEYDRILVDVPCTTDRHSLKDNENNIFNPGRVKERLKLPELQCELLVQGLKLVENDGIVVYSTCSLSPIQNDGVVHMALKQMWEESKKLFVVQDLSRAVEPLQRVFEFASRKTMKYGCLVLPHVHQNYGPTYFCRIKRVK